MLAEIPAWARPFVDRDALARLSGAAARVPPPDRRPQTHPPLGTFRWDDHEGGWVGRLDALGVDLVLVSCAAEEVGARLALHHWCVTRPRAVLDEALAFAATDLREHVYLQPGEPELTAASVRARLTLTAITLDDDASVLHFDDGDLFWGHYITVSCAPDGTPHQVDVAG